MIKKPKRSNIEKMFPILKVESNLILSKQGDVTLGFKIDLPEIFSLSSVEYHDLHAL